MAYETFSNLVIWFQNIALLLRQNVTLPPIFDEARKYFNAVLALELNNIPLMEYLAQVAKYTDVDFRVQFVILNIAFPLFFTFVTLLLFRSVLMIVWYFAVLFGFSLIVASVLAKLLPRTIEVALQSTNILGLSSDTNVGVETATLIVGCIILFICLVVAAIWLCFKGIKYGWKRYKRRKQVRMSRTDTTMRSEEWRKLRSSDMANMSMYQTEMMGVKQDEKGNGSDEEKIEGRKKKKKEFCAS